MNQSRVWTESAASVFQYLVQYGSFYWVTLNTGKVEEMQMLFSLIFFLNVSTAMTACSTVSLSVSLKLIIKLIFYDEEYTDQWFVSFSAGRRCYQSSAVRLQAEAAGQEGGTVAGRKLMCLLLTLSSLHVVVTVVAACNQVFASLRICRRMCRWRFGERSSSAVEPTKCLQVPDIKVYFF